MPNVSNAVVTTLSLQIPLLILAEAALSFLQYGDPLRDALDPWTV